jgi:hypothetical protein
MIDTAVRSRPRAVGDTLAARARRRCHARFAPRGERHDLSLRMTLDHAPALHAQPRIAPPNGVMRRARQRRAWSVSAA